MTQTAIIDVTSHTHFPIKLTPLNFPVWRKQVMATLVGLRLDGYVTGTTHTPSKTLASDSTKPNPAYLTWFRQDQTLLGALLGSCSEQIQHVITSAKTSCQAFEQLFASYASNSRSRIISLKSRLANNPQGSRPIAEYLHEMKTLADDLALAQSPISDEDLVVHILGQLGDDFAYVSAALKMRETTIKFLDLFDKLVDHERSLQVNPSGPILATVNQTQRQPARPSNNRPSSDYRTQIRFSNAPRLACSSTFLSGASSIPNGNRNSFFCNYCSILGHDTKDCRKLAKFLKANDIIIHGSAPVINTSSARPISPTNA
ncbi:uncharacterized protein LOC112520023 [Cynara cardunculus var. scolymus]|uniref:uncharacterized protein LOC112520023 n=1 Tax=Cynara cardunculus var. scolymus TaxID=59895 RepID=UPI000D62434B|nr:uncharacterized protein LOC112520023 [Cynara cardunculus var. scolymus]